MRESLEKLWNEYFAEECAAIETEEERALLKKTVEIQKEAKALPTKEQSDAIDKYSEVLYEMQGVAVKKAFFKGCQVALSFFLQVENFGTR